MNYRRLKSAKVRGWKKQNGMTTSYEWTHTEQHDKPLPTISIVSDMLDTQEDGRRTHPLGVYLAVNDKH